VGQRRLQLCHHSIAAGTIFLQALQVCATTVRQETRNDQKGQEIRRKEQKKKKKTVLVLLFFLEIQLLLEVIEPTVELLHVVDVCDG
jgi:predicted nucleic acid-binding Zn ribbon protein